ncbi:MAG: hypothetical protein HYY30_10510 [Chloroflexi bacterium]|nr:hypothetical protein [Chloroflexota bacterium]
MTKPNGDTFTTIDTVPPTVSISVPGSTSKTWLLVSWTAVDSVSGLMPAYDVDYGADGTSWTPWVRGGMTTSGLFIASVPGQRYYFRVVARDGAGNQGYTIVGPVRFGHDSSGLWKSWFPLVRNSHP